MLVISLITGLVIVFIFYILYFRMENFDVIDTTPIMKTRSMWDYYGNTNNYLFDKLASGHHINYPPNEFYCDRANRNRSFLVNPMLTQKHIFIKPNVNSYKNIRPYEPDWGNSAQNIRIGSKVETDPLKDITGENIFYGNFSKVVRDYNSNNLPERAYMDSYNYRCGVNAGIPINTYNNPY